MARLGRLTQKADFDAVYNGDRSWANPWIVLRALPNHVGIPRYGIVVSKRVGNAVLRNRVKRWLREGMRQLNPKEGWDMVFIARRSAANADYHRLKGAMKDLVSRARLLLQPGQSEDGER